MSLSKNQKPLLKKDIEIAKSKTISASAAARYLNVSLPTYKKYAVAYGLYETNQRGKGVRKLRKTGPETISNILAGNNPNYDKKRLRDRLLRAGVFKNECALCGFKESRADGKVPLTLICLDGNSHNMKRENLEMRCFNCAFLTTGKIDPRTFGPPNRDIHPIVYNMDLNEVHIELDKLTDFDTILSEAKNELEI